MLQIRFLSNLILAKSTFLQKEDTTYCLQPYFVPLPLSTGLLVLKAPSSKKVANRVFTHSASLRYASFVHTLFAFTSGLARWPLSMLAGKQ